MIFWLLDLDENSRRVSLNQASLVSGISVKAIEKDWWVTLVLKLLFTSKYAPFFTFKGGTSLSKGWGLIDRFSEDIDIVLNSEAFGMQHREMASKSFVEKLRREGCLFTSNEIVNELKTQFENFQIPNEIYSIDVDPIRANVPDKDPQIVYVSYKSLYSSNQYLRDKVKIEFNVRSQEEPNDSMKLQSLLNLYYPNEVYGEMPFNVKCMHPKRTLIEKILLLHEEYNRADELKMRTYRMSRHYYDLYRIYDRYNNALLDITLIEKIIQHRKLYSRKRDCNYSTMCIGQIQIIPSSTILMHLKNDYEEMAKEMLYGTIPTFAEVMTTARRIQDTFNQNP